MTQQMVRSFAENVKDDVKIHSLFSEDIKFCNGCQECVKPDKETKCWVDDKCEDIKKEALEADVVVFATPIYEFCVSAAMKRFLERCLSLATFKLGPAPKYKPIKNKVGVIMCSSGAPAPLNKWLGYTRYPKRILRLGCKFFRCDEIIEIYAGGMMLNEKMRDKWLKKVKAAAIRANE